ncbi:MAG: tetratricopeptide repeat protein, partial [Bacteroidota bacterium]
MNAFKNASEMDFSADIKKDAFLNYARLSYEIGNPYEPVPEVLQAYLKAYPKSEQQEEIQELLVDSYITSKNFEGAMTLLEQNQGYASKETYQKVAFYRGVELFVDGDYEAAVERFRKSLKQAENPDFEARALFWKAEALYQMRDYEAALDGFNAFSKSSKASMQKEMADLPYHLGYCHFKLKEYGKAVTAFKSVVSSGQIEAEKKADGHLRLGDSYFVTSQYSLAKKAYDEGSKRNGPERDYAAFQKALCDGFLGNNTAKTNGLNTFLERYPKSSLRDDAYFELGNTYVKGGNEQEGLMIYDKLISEYSKGKFAPRAMLRQGLVHYNASRNDAALQKLRGVVKEYPKTQEAKQAVATAKLVYIDEGRVGEYADWVRGLD